MGWAVGYDSTWNRDIGYGVPAYCDHPECSQEIDRGLSYVCCEQEPYGGENGCGLFFCSEHRRHYPALDDKGWDEDVGPMCERCATGRNPFDAKPDHQEWTEHKMTDPSWAAWRAEQAKENAK